MTDHKVRIRVESQRVGGPKLTVSTVGRAPELSITFELGGGEVEALQHALNYEGRAGYFRPNAIILDMEINP